MLFYSIGFLRGKIIKEEAYEEKTITLFRFLHYPKVKGEDSQGDDIKVIE